MLIEAKHNSPFAFTEDKHQKVHRLFPVSQNQLGIWYVPA